MKSSSFTSTYPYYLHLMDRTEYRDGKLYWIDKDREAGTKRKDGYISLCIQPKGMKPKHIKAHRFIWWLENGPVPDHLVIDHINGDRSDNRIENLQAISQLHNTWKQSSNSTSGVKNVVWHSGAKKWQVKITCNGVKHCFGTFEDLELAELVADEAREILFGEFARA
ncbi:HNH endonuclease [Klebsiella variicola]|uniref:HNH endonuclease n=1 Tax=Klebsiella variicola TaxID=244366 RepID=UPI003D0265E7